MGGSASSVTLCCDLKRRFWAFCEGSKIINEDVECYISGGCCGDILLHGNLRKSCKKAGDIFYIFYFHFKCFGNVQIIYKLQYNSNHFEWPQYAFIMDYFLLIPFRLPSGLQPTSPLKRDALHGHTPSLDNSSMLCLLNSPLIQSHAYL